MCEVANSINEEHYMRLNVLNCLKAHYLLKITEIAQSITDKSINKTELYHDSYTIFYWIKGMAIYHQKLLLKNFHLSID